MLGLPWRDSRLLVEEGKCEGGAQNRSRIDRWYAGSASAQEFSGISSGTEDLQPDDAARAQIAKMTSTNEIALI